MAAYIARRLIWVVFLLFVITLITFVIFSVLPAGDPAVARAGRQPSPELIASIRAAVRARQAQAGAVHQLHRRHPAVPRPQRRLLRVLLPEQHRRAARDPRAAPDDDLPDRRRRDPVALDRHPDRHPLRRQDRLAGWTASRWASRCSSSPPRSTSSASSRSTCSTTTSASSRSCRATRPTTPRDDVLRQGRGADHAVVRARGGVRGDLRALPARQPDRHAAGGLHPHGAGQGPVASGA